MGSVWGGHQCFCHSASKPGLVLVKMHLDWDTYLSKQEARPRGTQESWTGFKDGKQI